MQHKPIESAMLWLLSFASGCDFFFGCFRVSISSILANYMAQGYVTTCISDLSSLTVSFFFRKLFEKVNNQREKTANIQLVTTMSIGWATIDACICHYYGLESDEFKSDERKSDEKLQVHMIYRALCQCLFMWPVHDSKVRNFLFTHKSIFKVRKFLFKFTPTCVSNVMNSLPDFTQTVCTSPYLANMPVWLTKGIKCVHKCAMGMEKEAPKREQIAKKEPVTIFKMIGSTAIDIVNTYIGGSLQQDLWKFLLPMLDRITVHRYKAYISRDIVLLTVHIPYLMLYCFFAVLLFECCREFIARN